MVLNDSDDSESFSEKENLDREPTVNDYVVVRFSNQVHYVAQILTNKDTAGDYQVSFLRKREKVNGFTFPDVPDVAMVNLSDIIMLLPAPIRMQTKRLSRYLCFSVNFDNINIR